MWDVRVCQGFLNAMCERMVTEKKAFEILKNGQHTAALLTSKAQRESPEQEENIKTSL